ncbi:MAG TPA: GTPase Era [bacterium (Candidatus Stahlbacteria)]|nr:GTPase Era [Candidatus Stahlbacteria bacterium]
MIKCKTMRSGFVSILGRPNVGKSTLLNNLIGTKISSVTPKPQTTRHKILGILTKDDFQIVFLDTPGIFKPSYELQKVMVKTALSTIEEADLVILLVEPFRVEDELLKKIEKPVILAINKVDLVEKKTLLPLMDEYQKFKQIKEIIPISALYSQGLDDLIETIVKYIPDHEPFYPKDMLSDRQERFFVSEIIREKIFLLYRKEVPYATSVVVDEFREKEGAKDYIRAVIYVEKPSEKAILIGNKGRALKKVGEDARKDIEKFTGRPCYLDLWVKVKKGWRRDTNEIRRFGYGL